MISIALGVQVDDRQQAVSYLRWLCAAIQHIEDVAGKLSPFMDKMRDELRRNLSELEAHSRFSAGGPQAGVGVKSQATPPAVPRFACGLRPPGANHPPPSHWFAFDYGVRIRTCIESCNMLLDRTYPKEEWVIYAGYCLDRYEGRGVGVVMP